MKIKIFCINIIVLSFIILTVNFFCLKVYKQPLFVYVKKKDIIAWSMPGIDCSRTTEGKQYIKNGSILLMGCSFTFGTDNNAKDLRIPDEDTFSYKLAKYVKMCVYNRGFPVHGLQHVLYFLQSKEILSDIKNQPEYVIYTFIDDHIRRMFLRYFSPEDSWIYYNYNIFNILAFDRFIPVSQKQTLLDSFICQNFYIKSAYENIISLLPDNLKYLIFKRYILEINKEIKKYGLTRNSLLLSTLMLIYTVSGNLKHLNLMN